MLPDRTNTSEFAKRTLRNLAFIQKSRPQNEVHEVTQITLSLLGLVVIPFSRGNLDSETKGISLVDQDWPNWETDIPDDSTTLFDLVRHLRNAAAHGRVSFSSDSPEPTLVDVTFEDYKCKADDPYWRSSIKADQLLVFCNKLSQLIDDRFG
jgi:hypothetical protein